jgi:hypothetical protein
LEDISKYRKEKVDRVSLYYFISVEITKEEFQKTQEKIFGSYRKKKEISVNSQKILNYIASYISIVILLVFFTNCKAVKVLLTKNTTLQRMKQLSPIKCNCIRN